ncbi:MAG: HAD family phosphatase [Bacteroidia bacterium]|jgi:putative hydrolase of the HAD superfamily|nr:HAD family phosphatase [Bacteroidia bacterium]
MNTKISTIIFDLGGVILNLDQDKTIRAFSRLGIDLEAVQLQTDVLHLFEKGKINADTFRQQIKNILKGEITNQQIDDAWNAMLLDLPNERLQMLAELRKNATVILLSNTNSIHIDAFNNYFNQTYPDLNWTSFFDKVYYSYEIGLRKPDAEIYSYVLNQMNLKAENVVFIDDSKLNLKGANTVGITTIWAENPLDKNLFEQLKALTI